ncbi:MAG: hypothetical protein ACRDI2_16770, partial [Chloroflexota bacterium]
MLAVMSLWKGLRDRLLPVPVQLPWQKRVPPDSVHGTAPYAAWEAELTAYARLRTGSPSLTVAFALTTETGWTEDIHLTRPAPRETRAAFAAAELELEHLVAHYRHGWREATLFWHTWAHPTESILLPWPPWDKVGLPASVVRAALAEAVPALDIPAEAARQRERERTAAVWLASAWADGQHRALEVAERPGLAERLPLPAPPRQPGAWDAILYRLATTDTTYALHLRGRADALCALERLEGVDAADIAALVTGVLALVDGLRRVDALPPSPKQRPPWLRRGWGQWRRAPALRAALDHLARSPTTSAVAVATAAGRTHAALP